MQGVAGDPFSTVEQASQVGDRAVHGDAEGVFDGQAGAHLVGDRADAADAGGDVGWLGAGPSAQERLEEPRRLVDLEPDVADLARGDADMHRPLTLDPGERADSQGPVIAMAHDLSLPRPARTWRPPR